MAISSRDLFDEEFYLNANPDVAEALASGKIRSAFRHFERFGQFEGRDPSLLFDTAYYLAENPDVAAAVASGEQESAFKHFRKFGQFEGRTPIAQFDNNLYLAQNQDVAAAVSNGPFRSGYQHFVEYGQNENRPGAPNLVGVPFSTDSSRVTEFVAPVSPSELNVTLLPGQTQTIPIRVAVPRTTRPLPLDVFLLQDLSGSFEEDLPIVRNLVPNLTRELQSITTNTQFGISSFIDKPILPFGRNDGQHYVFRPDLTLTTDTAALQRTVGNYSTSSDLNIGEDSAEAQLEALLQTALRTREIGFRDGARRVVVVATDAPYHVAGDGAEAGITIPNNGNTVLDGNPPGTGEDYPSVTQVRNALQAANIVPVFAVTQDVIPDYEALVSQLGFGEVVELESDSSNLVDAIDLGLGGISSQIVPTVSSDDFGYVKGITPSRVSNVVPGGVYTFDVTLQGRSKNDAITLTVPGFGETVINVSKIVQDTISADFQVSPTDEFLRNNMSATAGGLIGGSIAFAALANPFAGIGAVAATYAAQKLIEGSTSFPYGVLRRDEFEIEDPNDTSKKIKLRIDEPSQRIVQLKYIPYSENNTQTSPFELGTETGKIWGVIHGWNDGSDPNGNLPKLAEALAKVRPNDRVFFLNWQQAANNGFIDKNDTNNIDSSLRVGNYFAAKWIRPVAEFVVKNLGIDAAQASQSLNLIGHSLGSLVSSEIGRLYKEGFTDATGKEVKGNNIGVSTITALDPPSQSNLDILNFAGVSYDLDGRNNQPDPPKGFDEVSNYSLAFVGTRSVAGNQKLAATASESFQMDFGGLSNPVDEHGQVVQTFTELLKTPENGQLQIIQQELIKERIFSSHDTKFTDKDRKARQNAYSYLSNPINPFSSVPAHEGILEVEEKIQPKVLVFKDTQTQNDDIVRGTNKDNGLDGGDLIPLITGSLLYDGSGNDTFYGDAGNDKIFGGTGNDTIYGNQGNDTINGEQDDDLIYGGQNEDYIYGGKGRDKIYGHNGNDTLEGNNGSDTLLGGIGSDRIWGGGDNSADILDGGEENDTLTGESGNDTLTGGAGDDKLEGGNDDDTLIGGTGKDTLTGGFGSDTFVFSPGDGASSRDASDIIEDFGTGLVFGLGGVDRIALAGGLRAEQIQLEVFGGNLLGFGKKTALIANGEYLAVLNGEFNKNSLNFIENFVIPTII
jgi:Ca2+-binding RTX toxin-like protein